MRRTAVINQIRGLLLERGITSPKGRSHLEEGLPGILAEAHTRFSEFIFVLLAQLRIELDQLSIRIEEMDVLIARTSERARRLPETDNHTRSRAGHRDRIGG